MLDGAIEDNLDAMRGRLPKPLRPVRRRVQLWARGTGWMALPVVMVMAGVGLARWARPVRVPTLAPAAALSSGRRATSIPRPPEPSESVLSQPIRPDVLSLAVNRVILDAGHGGDNLGTASAKGLLEKDLTLDLAERVRALVTTRGFDAVMTRSTDETLSLQQRADVANGRRGDIFVSIHLNSLRPTSARGVETYYLGPSEGPEPDAVAAAENQHSGYSLSDMRVMLERIYTDARRNESRRLAESVQRALVQAVRRTDPSITNRGVKMAPFVVLVATDMPAILAEVSCLSNPDEAERLRTVAYRETLAEALAAGIEEFAREQGGSETERTGTSGS
jgi:N-acetylmuramoyl-L-alanine amidase